MTVVPEGFVRQGGIAPLLGYKDAKYATEIVRKAGLPEYRIPGCSTPLFRVADVLDLPKPINTEEVTVTASEAK